MSEHAHKVTATIWDPNDDKPLSHEGYDERVPVYKNTTTPDQHQELTEETIEANAQPMMPPTFELMARTWEEFRVLSMQVHGDDPGVIEEDDVDLEWEQYSSLRKSINLLTFQAKQLDAQKALASSSDAPKALASEPTDDGNPEERRDRVDEVKDKLEGSGAYQIASEVITMVRKARSTFIVDGDRRALRESIELCELALDTKLWLSSTSERKALSTAAKRVATLRLALTE